MKNYEKEHKSELRYASIGDLVPAKSMIDHITSNGQVAYRMVPSAPDRLPLTRQEQPEGAGGGRLIERAEAIAMLRQVCAEFGDNDWNDDLHLADIIEKHLWRNLEAGRKP